MFKLINSCRLCRSYENINTTLHHIDSDNLSLFQKLNKIAPGILECNANLPNGICINCIRELHIAYKFINKCSESQTIFQRYLEQLRNVQQAQPANHQEILIKVIKLEETNCNNSEVNSSNYITVKDEKESGFLNKETNEKYNVSVYANDNSASNQADFKNDIKVEEEIRNRLANLKNENIEEICNDSIDDIQTGQRGEEIKLENNYYDEDASKFTKIEDNNDSININNEYECTDIKDIKIEEDDFENDVVEELPKNSGHFTGFDWVECNVANSYKVKHHLKLECLAKVINKEHKKNVNKVLKRSDIGKNSSNVNINIQAPYKCKIYNKPRNRRLNLTRPKRTRTDKKLDKPYQCVICGRATVSKYDLKKHIRIHTKEKLFKCETCKTAFTQSSSLKRHVRIHTNEKPFKCETCSRAFNDFSSLKQHIRIHTNEKPFKCETCSTSFNNPSNLKRHIRIHTNDKPFKCELCNKAFTQSSNLKEHIRIHTNDKPFKCELCNKAFTYSSNLKQHIRIHTNDKPFKCELCNKAFTQSSNLKEHIRIHTNDKSFKCELCNKAFTYSSNLKQHIRIHTNDKPFKCELCNKAFTQSSNLKEHIRIHTNDKPFKCELCNKTFTQSSTLKQHIRIHANKKQ